jgi:hypothetical protein
MKKQHLSEEEIQEYTFDMEDRTLEIDQHIDVCEHCQEKVDTYKLLFSEIGREPAPVFDFNVAEHVLPQLEKSKPEFSWTGLVIGCLAVVGAILTCLAIYGLRSLFSAILSTHLYLALTSACSVLVSLLLDSYKKYKERMKLLESY